MRRPSRPTKHSGTHQQSIRALGQYPKPHACCMHHPLYPSHWMLVHCMVPTTSWGSCGRYMDTELADCAFAAKRCRFDYPNYGSNQQEQAFECYCRLICCLNTVVPLTAISFALFTCYCAPPRNKAKQPCSILQIAAGMRDHAKAMLQANRPCKGAETGMCKCADRRGRCNYQPCQCYARQLQQQRPACPGSLQALVEKKHFIPLEHHLVCQETP